MHWALSLTVLIRVAWQHLVELGHCSLHSVWLLELHQGSESPPGGTVSCALIMFKPTSTVQDRFLLPCTNMAHTAAAEQLA